MDKRTTSFNSLPNDKFLHRSKLKQLADDKIDMTENLKFPLGSVENIVGKGGNAGYYIVLYPFRDFAAIFNCRLQTLSVGRV